MSDDKVDDMNSIGNKILKNELNKPDVAREDRSIYIAFLTIFLSSMMVALTSIKGLCPFLVKFSITLILIYASGLVARYAWGWLFLDFWINIFGISSILFTIFTIWS